MRHDPSLRRRYYRMLRAAVQRNFPEADVHAGLNTIDRNRSFAAGAPQVRVADFADFRCTYANGRYVGFSTAAKRSEVGKRTFAASSQRSLRCVES